MSNLFLKNPSSQAALAAGGEMVTIAGVSVALADAILLGSATAAVGYFPLKDKRGIDYQVPALKELVIVAVQSSGSGTVTSAYVGYGDTVSTGAAAAPTNDFSFNNGTGTLFFNGANGASSEKAIVARVPAGKYPYVKTSTTTVMHTAYLCYLVDV